MRAVQFLVLAASVGAACADSPELSATSQAILEGNRITTNRITTNRITTNRMSANRITTNRITTNRYTLNRITTNELLDDAEGRELLQYIVGCAVPAGVTLEVTHAGEHYEFTGEVGLAPKWLDRSLREGEQRWVSACLIARVNRFGVSVPISIRGPHEGLTVSEEEAEDFSVEEGAFYGNIFVPLDEPIVWNACRGRDEAVSESGTLDLRDCAEKDPAKPGKTLCGFNYAGDCWDWEKPKNAYACKKFNEPDRHHHGHHGHHGHDHRGHDCDRDGEFEGGYYEKCHDEPGYGRWPHAERFTEVITVFVMP